MQTIRYTKNQIKSDYDAGYDILTLVFGDVKDTYEDCEDPKFGFIRKMDTDRLVGISCYGYKRFGLHDALLDTLHENGVYLSAGCDPAL